MRAGRPWNCTRSRAIVEPAREMRIFGEQLDDRLVGDGDVRRVAGERAQRNGPFAFAEQRADIGGHEAGDVGEAVDATPGPGRSAWPRRLLP